MSKKNPLTLKDLVPKQWAEKNRVVPLELANGKIIIGTPGDISSALKNELSFLTGKEVEIRQLADQEIPELFEKCYGVSFSEQEKKKNTGAGLQINRGAVVQQVNTVIHLRTGRT